ncbi:MAG: cyclic nucleotide-binding domain-containing protein [Acidimicrobiia bacterium]|jgi:CRP-like cAMP-binding protein
MSLTSLKALTPLLRDLSEDGLEFLESVATEIEFAAGALIFDEDDVADSFYLIATGRAGLEVTLPAHEPVLIETLGPGELLGVSWLFEPYRWSWRARALAPTTAVAFDAAAVRVQCETDTDLALHVYKTVAGEALRRLHATRVRLLDLYPGGER